MYYNGSAWLTVGSQSNTPSQSNPVLNSAFQVWQRGTSVALAASTSAANGYTADRWDILNNASQAMTISRQATSDTTNLPNIQYCARVQRNSGQTGTGTIYMRQGFETINSIPFAGKTVMYSFYARAGANYSATSNYLTFTVGTGTGTDQNPMSFTGEATPLNNTTTALTTTWQRFTISGTLSASATQVYVGFAYTPTGTAGTNDYFEVTGVQLELGSTATPFDTYATTIQGELAACQRYYWRMNAAGVTNAPLSTSAGTFSTTEADAMIQLPVTMRAAPTTLDYSAVCFNTYPGTTYSLSALTIFSSGTTKDSAYLYGTISGGPAANTPGYYKVFGASTTAYLGFGAEL
jgi:hypothetical protein